jgi:hypothetical protein
MSDHLKQRDRFWNLLLIAAVISAVVSLLTTTFGLLNYLSFLLAVPLALAVQMGLFGLAWLIGFGENRIRPLMVVLYIVAMIFSVVFSYVFLQSELVEKVKPIEAQRQLFDNIRGQVTTFGNVVNEGVNESDMLLTKVRLWLDTEEEKGWATKTCEEETHCYLTAICERVRGKIAVWEEKTGKPYREGPGRELIHEALTEEFSAINQIHLRLKDFRDNIWMKSTVLQEDLDNRARLTAFDQIVAVIPKKDLESILCQVVPLPVPANYEDFARDRAVREEKQVYAFEDLMDILGGAKPVSRNDYPTIFALGLAIFIDLFVLIVAIGAALIADDKRSTQYPGGFGKGTEADWKDRLQEEVDEWVSGALLTKSVDLDERLRFVNDVMPSIIVDQDGKNVLIPASDEQYRFGIMLVKSNAAKTTTSRIEGREQTVFLLEDWVYRAIARYIRRSGEAG